jgi:hypothetical protein
MLQDASNLHGHVCPLADEAREYESIGNTYVQQLLTVLVAIVSS